MPLGYPIQDGDNNIVGVKRGPFRYMKQNFRRNELLDFVSRDFSEYAWTRVLQWHHVTYTDPTVEVDGVEDAVRRELEGPGKLLGYRWTCVCSNIRCRSRCARWKRLLDLRRRKTKGNYTSRGPNWVHAFDGHDKIINAHSPYRRLRMHWHL